MKLCLACGSANSAADWTCPTCGVAPARIEGFVSFAPDLAYENEGFSAGSHELLDTIQDRSFWFRSRNRLIADIVVRHFARARRVLEIGCGTGFVLQGIAGVLPDAEMVGSEIHISGLRGAARRLNGRAELLQMDADRIPYRDEFDVVCAFDVIEHIDDDVAAIKQMRQAARLGGGIFIAVPQHPFLWSQEDKIGKHKRRYRRRELADKCRACDLEIVLDTSFVCTLLPFMTASRLLGTRSANRQSARALVPREPLNSLFEAMLNLERWAIIKGVRFPVGGTRIILARKPTLE